MASIYSYSFGAPLFILQELSIYLKGLEIINFMEVQYQFLGIDNDKHKLARIGQLQTTRIPEMLSFKLYHSEHRQIRFKLMAEREGFEPSIESPLCRISSAVLSTTQPPLHMKCNKNRHYLNYSI